MTLLTTHDLSIEIDHHTILTGVNLHLAARGYLCLVGANGAGKSSLINALLGLLPIHSGSISLADKPLASYAAKARARQISYVPQHQPALDCTALELLKMSRYPYHSAFSSWSAADNTAIERAFTLTDSHDLAKHSIAHLSGGERQRVMIAAALAQETPLLLLDEPTNHLDPRYQAEIHQLLSTLNQQHGISIIEASHDINHAAHHSQHVLALKKGAVVWQGNPADFMSPPILNDIYDIHFDLLTHPDTGRKYVVATA